MRRAGNRPRSAVPEFPGSICPGNHEDLEIERWIQDHHQAEANANTTRGKVEAAIEQLVALLDSLDGDAEAEPDHDGEEGAEGEAWLQAVTLT